MSVQITFEPDGHSGLVAAGTNIWEAARRLGVSLPVECRGRAECVSCAVIIERGAEVLSPATSAEEKLLGPERLSHSERLACQAVLANQGTIILRLSPVSAEQQKTENTLRGRPFKEKVEALIELEAVTVTEALNSLRSGYQTFIGKVLNLTSRTAKEAAPTSEDGKRPANESPGTNVEQANDQD